MKNMVSTNCTTLIEDVKMGDTLVEEKDFTIKPNYKFSVLLYLPQSMTYEHPETT